MNGWQVLVTGSSGFIGRYMVEELEHKGAQVITCDLKTGNDLIEVLPKVEHRFDLVIHLACRNGGRRAINGLPMNLATNLDLDSTLFRWALHTKQKRVLYFSSAAAYPIMLQHEYSGDIRLREDMIQYGAADEPDAEYGWAKLTGERIAYAAMASGLPVHIVRPFSQYADDQSMAHPFPAFIKQAREHKDPFEIWGDSQQIRDWIHATDVVKGALEVVMQGVDEPINLCTGIPTSLMELARMLCAEADYHPNIRVLGDMPIGVHRRVGDPSLLFNVYRPRVDLEWAVKRSMRFTAPPAKPRL